jgi:hypothetical protein
VAGAPKPAPAPAPAPPTIGSNRIKVGFLMYSSNRARRVVALAIDQRSLVNLREGESAYGVEVVRIYSDRVEVRDGGQAVIVPARDE